MHNEDLFSVSRVSKLADCSDGTTRNAIDAGRLPAIRKADGQRLMKSADAALSRANRIFGLRLTTVNDESAEQLARELSKCTAPTIAKGFQVLELFSSLVGDRGRGALGAAVLKTMQSHAGP